MKTIAQHILPSTEAALWWSGKAVYTIGSSGLTAILDRDLLNFARGGVSGFSRRDAPAFYWKQPLEGYIHPGRFTRERRIHHANDRKFHSSVLAAGARNPRGMLAHFNGKEMKPGLAKAARFARSVNPSFVLPTGNDLGESTGGNTRLPMGTVIMGYSIADV